MSHIQAVDVPLADIRVVVAAVGECLMDEAGARLLQPSRGVEKNEVLDMAEMARSLRLQNDGSYDTAAFHQPRQLTFPGVPEESGRIFAPAGERRDEQIQIRATHPSHPLQRARGIGDRLILVIQERASPAAHRVDSERQFYGIAQIGTGPFGVPGKYLQPDSGPRRSGVGAD